MITTIELIQILDAIDRNGSFEAAASELNKVRSALTYSIKQFEDRMKIKLFERIGRRAKLTYIGNILLDQGRQLLNLNLFIERNIKQVATGWEPVLRIAYDEIININPLLQLIDEFKEINTSVNIELYTEIMNGCSEALINKKVDIAIGLVQPLPNINDLVFEIIGKTKFVYAVAPTHPLAAITEPINTDLLKEFTAIVVRDSARTLETHTVGVLYEQPRITVSSLLLKKQAQMLGLGAGYLPYNLIKKEINTRKLVIKKIEKSRPTNFCYLGWYKGNTGKALNWFIKKLNDPKFKIKLLA